jgi:hypothetical protein
LPQSHYEYEIIILCVRFLVITSSSVFLNQVP